MSMRLVANGLIVVGAAGIMLAAWAVHWAAGVGVGGALALSAGVILAIDAARNQNGEEQ